MGVIKACEIRKRIARQGKDKGGLAYLWGNSPITKKTDIERRG